ncbi:MAG: hypothetical protein Q4G44_03700 [Alcaligenaceae bacterium]|nr:hypothetical protein [Alcaligenaceae bacterium]
MKLLTRLREEFTSITHELYGQEPEQEVEYVSEHAADAVVLMEMLEQRKSHNDLA